MEPLLTEIPMRLDEEEFEERADAAAVIEARIRTAVAAETRLGVWRGETLRESVDGTGRDVVEIPLRCTAHPHPRLRLRWVHLLVDFGAAPDAVVSDLAPLEVTGSEPVRLVTRRSSTLSLQVDPIPIGPELAIERSSEQQIYFPEVLGTGRGFGYAMWTFSAVGDRPLHVDRDLRVLLSVPSELSEISVTYTLRAKLQARGVTGLIPLVGRRTVRLIATTT